MSKFSSTIAGATIIISVVGTLSRGIGFVREIIYANFFGTGSEYDIYLVAAALPITLNTILLYLGQNYFIPQYSKIDERDFENRKLFFINSFWYFLFFACLLSFVLYALSELIISTYLESASIIVKENASVIFQIFLLSLPLSAAISILSSYLQTKFEYKHPALSQLLVNFSLILMVVFFSGKVGVLIIPVAYVFGSLLQLVYLLVISQENVFRDFLKIKKRKFYQTFSLMPFIIIILIESIGQLYVLTDRYFYTQVEAGGLAALNYAMNIIMLPLAIFSVALSTAIFPKFSKDLMSNSDLSIERNLNLSIKTNLLVFVPITFIFYFFGDFIIKILFEHGKFKLHDTILTFDLIKIYSLSLIFYSTYAVLNKLIYSAGLINKLLVLTVAGIIIKIMFNFLLVDYYQQSGLAVSSSLSYLFFFIGALFVLRTTISKQSKYFFLKHVFFFILNGSLSLGIAIIIAALFHFTYYASTSISIFIFCTAYFINLKLIGDESVLILEGILKSISKANITSFFRI